MKKFNTAKIIATTMAVITMATAVAPIEAQAGLNVVVNATIYDDDSRNGTNGVGINLTTNEFSNVKITDTGVTFNNITRAQNTNESTDFSTEVYLKAGNPVYNFLKDVNSVDIYVSITMGGYYNSTFTITNKGEGINLDKKVAKGTSVKITNNAEFVSAMAVAGYTNQARYENGLGRININLDPTLFNASVAKGKEMLTEGQYGHANKAGIYLAASVKAAENIAIDGNLSQATTFMSIRNNAKSLVDQWMGSTGHKANMLYAGHTIMGASITNVTSSVYASSINYNFTTGGMGVQMFK